MATPAQREFHGRDAELALIRREFRERIAAGAEAVVIVEGGCWDGEEVDSSRRVTTLARSLDIRVGSHAAIRQRPC